MAAHIKTSRRDFLARRFSPRLKLFISYRRRFDHASARLLEKELTKSFGEGAVFLDIDDIVPGTPWAETIEKALASCDVFLPIISPGWLESAGRLQEPNDITRREIVTALERQIPVIPLLVGGARMPRPEEMPPEVALMMSRQAFELSESRWDYDVRRLVELIFELTAVSEARPASFFERTVAAFRSFLGTWLGKATAVAVLAAVVSAAYLYNAADVTHDKGLVLPTPELPSIYAELSPTYAECLKRLRPPGTHRAVVMVEDSPSAEGTPIVWVDEYKRVSPPPPEGFPILVELYDPVGARERVYPLGAVSLRFLRGDYPKGGAAFKVDKVVEPPCKEVTDYSNEDSKAKAEVYNWDGLSVRLRGRSYRLRLGDHKDTLLATLTRETER